jgi:hypothetical protein
MYFWLQFRKGICATLALCYTSKLAIATNMGYVLSTSYMLMPVLMSLDYLHQTRFFLKDTILVDLSLLLQELLC